MRLTINCQNTKFTLFQIWQLCTHGMVFCHAQTIPQTKKLNIKLGICKLSVTPPHVCQFHLSNFIPFTKSVNNINRLSKAWIFIIFLPRHIVNNLADGIQKKLPIKKNHDSLSRLVPPKSHRNAFNMHNSNQYWWVLCRKFLLLLSWNVRVLGHKGKLFYPKLFNMGPLLCLLTHWVIHSRGWLTTHGHNTQYFIMPWSDYQCFSTEPAKNSPPHPKIFKNMQMSWCIDSNLLPQAINVSASTTKQNLPPQPQNRCKYANELVCRLKVPRRKVDNSRKLHH